MQKSSYTAREAILRVKCLMSVIQLAQLILWIEQNDFDASFMHVAYVPSSGIL